MTDKRYFALIGEDGYVYPVFFDSENEDKEIDVDTVVDLLNENENLKQSNSQLAKVNREGVKKVQKLAKENEQLRHDATILIQSNQDYRKENEQLKQRNNRQAKQLDRLYNLIEQKDWRTLNDILDDFKRCEEQLQREWRTYK